MRMLLITLSLTAMLSCEHKSLCYEDHGGNLFVDFDWSESHTRSEALAEGMRLYFYPESGGEPIVNNLSADGQGVDIPVGSYYVVSFNNDTQSHLWRGAESLASLECYTREADIIENSSVASPSPPVDGESVRLAPETMWSVREYYLQVGEGSDTLILQPQVATSYVSFELVGVENTEYITMAYGALSGVAASHFVASGASSTESATIAMAASVDDSGAVVGECVHFGCLDVAGDGYLFTIYLYSSGGGFSASFDVSDEFAKAADPTDVHLVLESDLVITQSSDSADGGGFSPGVSDWESSSGSIVL
ncbi:MAG: DUF5119 domain-containing protein [Rikenellaceae bacterium]